MKKERGRKREMEDSILQISWALLRTLSRSRRTVNSHFTSSLIRLGIKCKNRYPKKPSAPSNRIPSFVLRTALGEITEGRR